MKIPSLFSFFSFLNPANIKHWFNVENLFVNYFWFFSVNAIIYLFTGKAWLYNYGFPLIVFFLCVKSLKIKKITIIDFFWIVSFLYGIFTWMINDYPHKDYLIFRCICQEVAYMSAFWIARNGKIDYIREIIINAKKPLVIACIIGIYCFVFEPAWYVNSIAESLNRVGIDRAREELGEYYRLKSIYSSPYVLAYFCAIVILYEIHVFLGLNKKIVESSKTYSLFFTVIVVITSVLCMMRAPILSVIVGVLIALLYYFLYMKNKYRVVIIIIPIIFLMIAFQIVLQYLDSSTIDFMSSKVENINSKDYVKDRFFLQQRTFSMLGEGWGKYNAITMMFSDTHSIADGEYMKVFSEQGFIGGIIFMIMWVVGFIKAMGNFKYLYLELSLLCMLFICMIGADPLSTYDKHCFIFWMALGNISKHCRDRINYKNEGVL